MKHITSFIFLCSTTVFLTFLPHPVVCEDASTNLVEQVCSQTDNKDNCVASLESNPDSKNATLTQLGIIALTLASENATSTSLYIKELLQNTTIDPAIEQALNDCSDHYLDAADQLNDSLAALLADAHKDVKTWVQAAIVDAESCEDGFKDHPEHESVLSSRCAVFRELCNNVLAINNLLTSSQS